MEHRDQKEVRQPSPEEAIVEKLIKAQETISCAESCTGGLLSGTIINVAGVSAVYKQGYITYSDEAKNMILGVPQEVLTQYTAVSAQTAEKMAEGVCKVAGSDWGLSTTGYAGPEGGPQKEPVGLVFIGCSHHGDTVTRRLLLQGDRQRIREEAVKEAMLLLLQQMNGENA